MSIPKLLIANRGEIAVRIIRACRECGIRTVAVYSEADCLSPHVSLADESVLIGPPPASESYLRVDKIIEAARATGADAIHPGYGFLSENADFAQACEDAGLTFVGPPSGVIRLLGDKIRAKKLMVDAGVPLVPGYIEEDQSDDRLTAEADRIGYPLLIKASAGGGGRGMRVVREGGEFLAALEEARRESQAAFGDSRVLLERYIERSRHIEFQIFGDSHGSVIHLFERECSIQRRHQKIVEESPSPALTAELRERMAAAAVAAGRAAGYVNAGTVEFLFEERPDGDHQFYFLEVNTRLQVEHPVTELLTGIDLVRLQLQVAFGSPLPYRQEDVRAFGHAVEARIYAEDPATGFLPSFGTLTKWSPPTGPGVRLDSGVEEGVEVSPYYDPMLAKLITFGENRDAALQRMHEALTDLVALGVTTNVPLLRDIVCHPAFVDGKISTRFLADHFADWRQADSPPEEVLLALAAHLALNQSTPKVAAEMVEDSDAFSPWRLGGGWRPVARQN
jgi:acetyl-CoA carboxylase biotin carboxylase subunit